MFVPDHDFEGAAAKPRFAAAAAVGGRDAADGLADAEVCQKSFGHGLRPSACGFWARSSGLVHLGQEDVV